jgi:dephospho-CoA kinase
MKKVLIITGGIATGKSFILNYMKKIGYPVMKSDEVAKEIMSSSEFLSEMQKKVGAAEQLTNHDLRQAIEKEPNILQLVEEIVYPQIKVIRDKWIAEVIAKGFTPVIEIPLFFEKKIAATLSEYELITITTICGKREQIKRCKRRRKKLSNEMIEAILARQLSDEERVARSRFIIYTYLSKSVVKKQLNKILKFI